MKNLQNWIIIGILALVAIFGGGYYLSQNKADEPGKQTTNVATESSQVKNFVASLQINDGENIVSYDLVDGEGQTALEVTQKATGGQVETSGEGINAFVTSINGRKADDSKKEYWELVVNDKPASVGAGSYKVKNGDAITWRISKY